jgi:hypothetical protein
MHVRHDPHRKCDEWSVVVGFEDCMEGGDVCPEQIILVGRGTREETRESRAQ